MTAASITRLIFEGIISFSSGWTIRTLSNVLDQYPDDTGLVHLTRALFVAIFVLAVIGIPIDSFYLWLGLSSNAREQSQHLWVQIISIASLVANGLITGLLILVGYGIGVYIYAPELFHNSIDTTFENALPYFGMATLVAIPGATLLVSQISHVLFMQEV